MTRKTTEGAAIKYANAGIVTGELAGTTAATQVTDLNTELINFKAVSSNAGNVYIGGAGVTKVDGTTDATTGFELGASEETGFIPVTNANILYYICDNIGDDLTYIGVL